MSDKQESEFNSQLRRVANAAENFCNEVDTLNKCNHNAETDGGFEVVGIDNQNTIMFKSTIPSDGSILSKTAFLKWGYSEDNDY